MSDPNESHLLSSGKTAQGSKSIRRLSRLDAVVVSELDFTICAEESIAIGTVGTELSTASSELLEIDASATSATVSLFRIAPSLLNRSL